MKSTKIGKQQEQKIIGTRTDKKVECYPKLSFELIKKIDSIAKVDSSSRTAVVAALAHHAIWHERILDQFTPYLRMPVALAWHNSPIDNTFHTWFANPSEVKNFREVIDELHEKEGQRVKFRVVQQDRARLQALSYALGCTSADALWAVLIGIAMIDGKSIFAVTRKNGIRVSGHHPLTGEWKESESWGTVL